MRRLKITDLNASGDGHILTGLIPETYLCKGTRSYRKAGQRTHDTGCS